MKWRGRQQEGFGDGDNEKTASAIGRWRQQGDGEDDWETATLTQRGDNECNRGTTTARRGLA
jgi:hypothetical protein